MMLGLKVTLLLAAAFCLSWFLVGKLISYLISKDIVDKPNNRTLHIGTVPRGGGLVIVVGLITTLVVFALTSSRPQLFACLMCMVIAWSSLSWWDDNADLSPKLRIIIQLIIAAFTVAALGWVSQLFSIQLLWLGPILTAIGLLWMANLYNFMDGLDGLAASQTIIGAITLAFWFFTRGDFELSLVCALVAALSYGFLLWNWSPAKIFMGDVGSITLGGFFGTIFIIGVTRYDLSIFSFIGLFGVFIADATSTIVMRALRREKIWLPHRTHFYQRLANMGYSHSKIALGGIVFMLICSALSTLGVIHHDMIFVLSLAIVCMLIAAALSVVYLERRSKI